MQPELYSDGISEITVTGSVVRIDLMSLSATERDADNNPKPVLRQRIIFSVEGFANSADVMQKALQGLVEAGVVRRSASGQPASIHAGPSGVARVAPEGEKWGQRTKLSPNFP